MDRLRDGIDSHVPESLRGCKPAQVLGVCESVLGPLDGRRAGAKVLIECVRQRVGSRSVFNCAKDAQSEPSAWRQHSLHFTERGRSVREELKPELAQHQIESFV